MEPPEQFLRALFRTAVAAADPALPTLSALPEPPRGRVLVLGAGKAAAPMAVAVEDAWLERLGPARFGGFVVTPDGHQLPTRHLEALSAAHPIPDSRSEAAARRALAEAARLGPEDLLLMLVSGGGSAVLAAPAPGVSLADKQAAVRAMLRAGLPIADINAVRRRLSLIKGGRLALAAAPARICNLVVSDVPGDDPALVASGPTLALETARPLDFMSALPEAARRALSTTPPPPSPGDSRLPPTSTTVILRARDALAAVATAARAGGCEVMALGELEGEARDLGEKHAVLASALRAGRASGPPLLILSGGEATVRVSGRGEGGRNTEYLLALALALDGAPGVHALAADTDGLDGKGGHAGGLIRPDSLRRWTSAGLDPRTRLEANDSRKPFATTGDLLETGPTRTNVNDIRLILLTPTQ